MDQAIALLSVAQDSASHLVLAGNVPNPGNGEPPPGVGTKFEDILGWAKWIALGIAVLAFIVTGAKMGINQRRGEGGETLGTLGMISGGVCVIAAAVSLVSFLVTSDDGEETSSARSEVAVVATEWVHTDG